MKRFVKIAAVVVAVVLVAAVVVPMVFRDKITELVKREANAMLRARLDFEALDISLLRHFPHASLDLKRLTLVGAERFEGDTIASVGRISVVVDVLSLLGDDGFEVSKLIVARPNIHARKLSDGAVNWDVMKPAADADTTATADTAKPGQPSAFRLKMRDVRISDARLDYRDDSTGMHFSTSPASLRLRGDMSARQTDLDLSLALGDVRAVSGNMTLLSGAEAALDAVISADMSNNRFTFSNNTLRLNAIKLDLTGWVELRDQAVALNMRAGCEKVQFKELLSLIPAFYARDFRSLTASGEMTMSLWARGVMRDAQLPAYELKVGVRNGSFQYSSLPKAVTDINLAVRVANPGGVMDRTEVELSQFGLKMAGSTIGASLYATNLISDPEFRASVSGRLDLAAVKEVYPLEKGEELSGRISADVKVVGRMSDVEAQRYERIGASGSFVVEGLDARMAGLPAVVIRRAAATITPASMTLGELDVRIGRSDLTANGQLSGYIGYLMRDETLSGRLYVKSDLLDLNEIIASGQVSAAPTATSGDKPDSVAAQAPIVPRNLNLSLIAELRKIELQKMALTDLSGEIRVADGTLALERLSMHLFGGTATASGYYSTAADPHRPLLKLGADVAGASFAKTFEQLDVVRELVPLFEKTGGDYSLALDLSTLLDGSLSPELMTLNARGELHSSNIRIEQIGALDALAAALKNDAMRTIEAPDLAIRFVIRDGRITTQPFDLRLGNAQVNLSGSTGLDQTIDYTALVSLPGAATGGVLSKVHVGIGGTFSAPKITLGVKEAVEESVKNIIDKQVEQLTGSKTLSEEVQKQTARLREEAQKAGLKLVEVAQTQRTKLVGAAKNPLAKLAAEKAGDKLVKEAERQAANLQAEAEKQIEKLTSKSE